MTKKFTYTIANLIEILREFPQDLPVLVSGYENGFENPLAPEKIKLEYKPENQHWAGEFQKAEEENKETFDAVILRRAVRDV